MFSLTLLFTGTLQGSSCHSKGEKNKPVWKSSWHHYKVYQKCVKTWKNIIFIPQLLNFRSLGYRGLSHGTKCDFSGTGIRWVWYAQLFNSNQMRKDFMFSLQSSSKLHRRVRLLQLFFPRSSNTGWPKILPFECLPAISSAQRLCIKPDISFNNLRKK